jgi:hypothetical protein
MKILGYDGLQARRDIGGVARVRRISAVLAYREFGAILSAGREICFVLNPAGVVHV